ncbi:High affinity choline transporter 1 [Armadillidium vulgare]|nr:High affinity choline transporter 1 [Armadillidium vulgare]
MAINVGGLIVICFFYAVIFLVGIWAAWKRRAKKQDTDETILAGRSLGTFVGVMTLTGGIFFAKKMRDARYVTMLDPFQNLFGKRWGSMLFFPALAGEMLYSAAILAALDMYIFSYRTTMAVMLNLNSTLSIIISAAIAASYTIFGGLAAVAYTDVVQLFCIFMGLRKQNITLNNIKKVTSPKADVESDMVNDTAVNLILNPAKSYFHPFENILIDSEVDNGMEYLFSMESIVMEF